MSSDDRGLFEVDQHPDAAAAREEITAYYDNRIDEARAAVAKAQAELDRHTAARAAFLDRGEITVEGAAGHLHMGAILIVSYSVGRYQRAASAAIDNRGNATLQAAAEAAGDRERALRRWLTAKGYTLGDMALPPPPTGRRGRRG